MTRALALGLFAVACSSATVPLATTWEAQVEPLSPGGVKGSVAVLSQAGRASTSIQITRAQPDAVYAWRIESGGCPGGGDVVGGLAVYPELVPGPQGSASGETVLSRELEPDGTYAARVFGRSEEGGEEARACGILRRTR